MSVEVKQATLDDAEEIVALLEGFYPGVPDHWRKLFKPRPWRIEGEFPGLIIVDKGKIVGFLGFIFSEFLNAISEKNFKICNLTTWYIDPLYRQYTMPLLMHMLRMPNVSWTNLTSTPLVYPLFKKLGFQDLEDTQTLLLPFPSCKKYNDLIEINLFPKSSELLGEEQHVQRLHQTLSCQKILIQQGKKRCYCLAVITQYKKLPLAKIYYMSNSEWFGEILPSIRLKLCMKLHVAYLIIEGDIFKEKKIWGAFKKKLAVPRLFKSDQLSKKEVPLLCSELFVLGI